MVIAEVYVMGQFFGGEDLNVQTVSILESLCTRSNNGCTCNLQSRLGR
jgi:hypothetical protein